VIAACVILLAAASSFLFAAGDTEQQQTGPAGPVSRDIGEGGFIPPLVYMHDLHATPQQIMAMPQAPIAWDWRTSGDVTSIKNQNPYGTCWAFSTIGCLESALHIQRGLTRDYSEYNVISCADNHLYDLYGYNCNTGGNAVMTYGPVITAMYSSWAEFNYYDTDTCLTYPGEDPPRPQSQCSDSRRKQ